MSQRKPADHSWVWEERGYFTPGELSGALIGSDPGGEAVEVGVRLVYNRRAASPESGLYQEPRLGGPVWPPLDLTVAGRPATLGLERWFDPAYEGVETFDLASWSQVLSLSIIDPAGAFEACFSASVLTEAFGPAEDVDEAFAIEIEPPAGRETKAPPPPDPLALFSPSWRPTIEALSRQEAAALEGSPLLEAAEWLLAQEGALGRRSTFRLVSIEARIDGRPVGRFPWEEGSPLVTVPAPPGSRLELDFEVERRTWTAYVGREVAGVEADEGRLIEVAQPGYEGEPHLTRGRVDAQGRCRVSLSIDNPLAKKFTLLEPSSPSHNIAGEIFLRYGRPVEATLASGLWPRAVLDPRPDREALAQATADDLDRAYDPDYHCFRGWAESSSLTLEDAGPRESWLLKAVASAGLNPEAMKLWQSISDKPPPPFSLHGVDLHPPESESRSEGKQSQSLLEQARRNLPPGDDWDRALALNVLALIEKPEQAPAAAELAEILAGRMERHNLPVHVYLTKAYVGPGEDRQASLSRLISVVALLKSARRFARPQYLEAASSHLTDLIDERLEAETSPVLYSQALAVLEEAGQAGLGGLEGRRPGIEVRLWEMLLAQGEKRCLRDSLEVLSALQGRPGWYV